MITSIATYFLWICNIRFQIYCRRGRHKRRWSERSNAARMDERNMQTRVHVHIEIFLLGRLACQKKRYEHRKTLTHWDYIYTRQREMEDWRPRGEHQRSTEHRYYKYRSSALNAYKMRRATWIVSVSSITRVMTKRRRFWIIFLMLLFVE